MVEFWGLPNYLNCRRLPLALSYFDASYPAECALESDSRVLNGVSVLLEAEGETIPRRRVQDNGGGRCLQHVTFGCDVLLTT